MAYQDYHKRIYKTKVFIRDQKTLKRFEDFQHKLQKEGIALDDYAENALLLAKDWANSKDMNRIPANLFIGDWLYGKYKKLKSKKTVKLVHSNDSDHEDVLYTDELLVAKFFLDIRSRGERIRFREAVEELSDVLSDEWKSSYQTDKLRKFTTQVLNELEKSYNVSALNYWDLADKINGNN